MKNILITGCLLMASTTALASNWSNSSFPQENPVYSTIGKSDETDTSKLNFSCSGDFKNIILMTLSGVNLEKEKGEFIFKASKKDKKSTNISGKFHKSPDGRINLITGYQKSVIANDMKKLNGVSLILSSNGKNLKTLNYNLSGSSKNINLFENKCKNLK